jgi:hypothetical protein
MISVRLGQLDEVETKSGVCSNVSTSANSLESGREGDVHALYSLAERPHNITAPVSRPLLEFMVKISPVLLLMALNLPTSLLAQDTLAAELAEAPLPPELVAAELARSGRCVLTLARLDTLDTSLGPLARQVDRIEELGRAVTREDSMQASPFDVGDPMEEAVRQWFAADQVLARQYAESGESTIEAERAEGRDQILGRLQAGIDLLQARGAEMIAASEELPADLRECEDAILVRSAVLEECGTMDSTLCSDARAATPSGSFRFVNAPEDLWDIESVMPWSSFTPVGVTPQGGVGEAQTNTVSRRGNLLLALGVRLLIQDRSTVSPDQLADLQASLDSLGFAFEHPQFLVAPVLALGLNVSEPIAGAHFYFLHFGDLSEPANDVIWSAPTTARGPVEVIVPAKRATLNRLAEGEIVTLTAVRFPDATSTAGEAVFSLELTSVGEARSVSAFLSYLTAGQLADDLTSLVPPAGG